MACLAEKFQPLMHEQGVNQSKARKAGLVLGCLVFKRKRIPALAGKTYDHRDLIKAHGGVWVKEFSVWQVADQMGALLTAIGKKVGA